VRAVTIERGRDPQEFTLVAFGGNGPLYAAEMARSLEIGTVLVPPAPGVWSAVGLLEAEMEHHLVRTFLRPLHAVSTGELAGAVALLEDEARGLLTAADGAAVEIVREADLKYQGQSFELTVPLPVAWSEEGALQELARAFGEEHERTYGHKAEGDPIQVVNLRLTVRARHARGRASTRLVLVSRGRRSGRDTDVAQPRERDKMRVVAAARGNGSRRDAYFGPSHGRIATPVIARADLGARPRPGPLLIDEYDATTLVPPGCRGALDRHGNIVMRTRA